MSVQTVSWLLCEMQIGHCGTLASVSSPSLPSIACNAGSHSIALTAAKTTSSDSIAARYEFTNLARCYDVCICESHFVLSPLHRCCSDVSGVVIIGVKQMSMQELLGLYTVCTYTHISLNEVIRS